MQISIADSSPPDGWAWVYDALNRPRGAGIGYRYRAAWDGAYIAPCVCGRDAIWNAWTSQVQYCPCDG